MRGARAMVAAWKPPSGEATCLEELTVSDDQRLTTKPATWHAPPNVPCVLADADGSLIASAAVKGVPYAQQMANARLLAAAPALRDALLWCVAFDGECLGDYPAKRAKFEALLLATQEVPQ